MLLFDLRRSAVSFSCCWFDDRVAVVYDGFPKVQMHLLIITCSSSASLPWLLLREQARIHLLIVARDISGTIPPLMTLCATAATYHMRISYRHLDVVTRLSWASAPLLLHMHRVALAFVDRLRQNEHPHAAAFQAGFHSIPSLVPLHMHVMSRDFDRYARTTLLFRP